MKTRDSGLSKSEFQIILENKLVDTDAASGPKSGSFSSTSSESASSDDFMATLSSLFFSQGPVRQNIVTGHYQKSESSQKSGAKEKSASHKKAYSSQRPKDGNKSGESDHTVIVEMKAQSTLKIKVKRPRTFDQIKALATFVKFGEKDLNDFTTDEEIKAAYRRLAKKYHPDAGAQNDLNFKIISAAYKKLIF